MDDDDFPLALAIFFIVAVICLTIYGLHSIETQAELERERMYLECGDNR